MLFFELYEKKTTRKSTQKNPNYLIVRGHKSGYQDSNLGPPAPKAGTLAGLRHIPITFLSNASAKVQSFSETAKFFGFFLRKYKFNSVTLPSEKNKTMQRTIFQICRYFVILLTFTLFFAACSPNDPSKTSSLLRIQLTDTPLLSGDTITIPPTGLYIDIQRIELFSDEEWTVFDGGEYNVLPLSNGRLRQIADEWFPADRTITKIRLVLGNNSHIWNVANQEIPLTIHDKEITIQNVNTSIVLNAVSSIVIELNSLLEHNADENSLILTVSPRAFDETSSSLRGSITQREARAEILIEHTELPIALRSFADAQGSFNILGVEPGYWFVSVFPDPETGWLDSIFAEPISVMRHPRINNLPAISLRANVIQPDPEPEEPDDDEEDDDE